MKCICMHMSLYECTIVSSTTIMPIILTILSMNND
uniref:Uncharacterized protein n=1 Tax=Arundo donax TaxID=35708 RepID=A0A0A9CKW1_ARUDO